MKQTIRFTLFLALAVLASTELPQLFAQSATHNHDHSVQISGTIYGHFDYTFDGAGAWVGYALVQIGDQPAKAAAFVDRNTLLEQKKNGVIAGTETLSLSFVDGSGSFDILARFDGIPASTPGLYTLHEAGTIANGLGQCKGLSGLVTVHGPFMFPDPKLKGDTLWMAEIHGTAFGVN